MDVRYLPNAHFCGDMTVVVVTENNTVGLWTNEVSVTKLFKRSTIEYSDSIVVASVYATIGEMGRPI